MKKFFISKFDLGFIIAFVVVTLLGVGAYWYLSGQLQDAQAQDADAKSKFDKYSKDTKYKVGVSPANVKVLQGNIDVLKKQIDPLVPAKLQTKDSKLASIQKEDPVAWKHDLDDDVHRLTDAARAKGVGLPPDFYFGFTRYLSQSPGDEQTAVLSKQLVAVDQIANILIKSQVKSISALNRTYEEDPRPTPNGQGTLVSMPNVTDEKDHLGGFSFTAPNNSYTSYPFEAEFVTTPENLRPILSDLLQSPYVFIVRTVNVTSSALTSPEISSLDSLAGTVTAPGGDASAPAVPKGPQYLFGNATITVKLRIDMIEWKGGQE
jgi:hypothetical protein